MQETDKLIDEDILEPSGATEPASKKGLYIIAGMIALYQISRIYFNWYIISLVFDGSEEFPVSGLIALALPLVFSILMISLVLFKQKAGWIISTIFFSLLSISILSDIVTINTAINPVYPEEIESGFLTEFYTHKGIFLACLAVLFYNLFTSNTRKLFRVGKVAIMVSFSIIGVLGIGLLYVLNVMIPAMYGY